MKFFEEIELGETVRFGSFTFTEREIIDFATKWDPQSFHTDPEAARESSFGALCASGWHTACVWMKLYTAYNDASRQLRIAAGEALPRFGASPGFRDLQWRRPVYVDDTIEYSANVIGKRTLASRRDWGLVTSRNEGINQKGELAFAFTSQVFVERRPG